MNTASKEEIKIYKQARRFIVMMVVLFLMPVQAWADLKEDYDNSRELYIAALACMAAYHDKGAKITFSELENDGWHIYPYSNENKYTDASFLYARKTDSTTGKTVHLLAITGTEDTKDFKVDLHWGKTDFEKGTDIEKTAANPAETTLENKTGPHEHIPQVHTGFWQYLNSIVQAKTVNADNVITPLPAILRENPAEKIYLMGHSMGGAVAVLGGAKLLEMGVREEQIKIITFGAPAVGNKAFAEKFAAKLDIKRVVNYDDPIPGTLQKVPGGYTQFGQEIEFASYKYIDIAPHKMAAYLDFAMRNYFDTRFAAIEEGAVPGLTDKKPAGKNQFTMYIAPIKNNLPATLAKEFVYIREILLDGYREMYPGYIIGEDSERAGVFKKAREAGCEMVVFSEITGYSLRDRKNEHYLTLSQLIYRTDDGSFLKAISFANSSKSLTPLISTVYNIGNMQSEWLEWLEQYKAGK